MIQVMSDPGLHVKASLGYKYTGTNVALNGDEDKMICREAKDFWRELEMRKHIDAADMDMAARVGVDLGDSPFSLVESCS